MAITRNAKKANRVSSRKREVNDKSRRSMRTAVKDVRASIAKKDEKATKKELSLAFKALDKAAKRGVIKKGTADRKKSRLAKAIAKMK
jgi:small subunit ribosomal protein S20